MVSRKFLPIFVNYHNYFKLIFIYIEEFLIKYSSSIFLKSILYYLWKDIVRMLRPDAILGLLRPNVFTSSAQESMFVGHDFQLDFLMYRGCRNPTVVKNWSKGCRNPRAKIVRRILFKFDIFLKLCLVKYLWCDFKLDRLMNYKLYFVRLLIFDPLHMIQTSLTFFFPLIIFDQLDVYLTNSFRVIKLHKSLINYVYCPQLFNIDYCRLTMNLFRKTTILYFLIRNSQLKFIIGGATLV